jgi:spore coat protein U domain-containing protein, fimbrial subunit CupE1/2/3/6
VKTRNLRLAAVALLFAAHAPAFAASKTATFNVSTSVVSNCTISASNMNFGSYDPVGANSASGSDALVDGQISLNCTKSAPGVTVTLDLGLNPSGGARTMTSGTTTDALSYVLQNESNVDWTPTSGTVGYGPFSSAATAISHTVHGILAKGQDVAVGNYSDTVTATVNF